MSLSIFQNEKTPFQAIKTRSSKRPKMAICPTFFFQAMYARKMSFAIFQNEKTLFQAKKTRSSKSPKIDIFSKGVNTWFQSKNGHFSTFFFQAIQPRKMSYTIFQNEKTPFLGYKNKKVQKDQKLTFFQVFLLGNIGKENVFYNILERKNAFQGYKNKKFKKSKN